MNALDIEELYQNNKHLQAVFHEETDELLYYDVKNEFICAYQHLKSGEWKEVFSITDSMKRWIEIIHPDEKDKLEEFLNRLKMREEHAEMNCRCLMGEYYYWFRVQLFLLSTGFGRDKQIAVGIRRRVPMQIQIDATQSYAELEWPSRVYMEHAWKEELEHLLYKYKIQKGMLFVLDFNCFHVINEKFGYRVADSLLENLIQEIREQLSYASLIGKLGPDVLGVYVNDVIDQMNWIAKFQRAIYNVKQKYRNSGLYDFISISAGTACYPEDANNYQELYDKAREAWVFSKVSKIGGVKHYSEDMLHSVFDKYFGSDWNKASCFDELTKLYTIEEFKKKTKEIINRKKPKKYVMVYADVSNFKYINANFDYKFGDKVLQQWAKIVKEQISSVVFAGRESEDRFVGLRELPLEFTEKQIVASLNEGKSFIEKQMRDLFPGTNFTLNMGAYCMEPGEQDVRVAMTKANMARKKARNTTTRCELYTEQMKKKQDEETKMVSLLDQAIVNHEFVVYLQPKVSCKTEKIVGAEALVRWQQDGKNVVNPGVFISVFEKYGCITKVDYCVYEQVFYMIYRWMREGRPIIPVSVNVSRVHLLDTAIIDKIESLMQQYHIPADSIEFEITESMCDASLPGLQPVLKYFKDRGFKIAMDDFGAECSNLHALGTIPVDVVKVDKVFLPSEGMTENDKIILASVIKLARDLQKEILCEGVETEEQKEFITSIGCDLWQGYLSSKPIPIADFEGFLVKKDLKTIA